MTLDSVSLQRSEGQATDLGPSTELCWICMGCAGEGLEHRLERPCACASSVHLGCLARWQLRCAGQRQETHCRLCDGLLPPWQEVVERIGKERLPSLNISDAVIDVSIQGHNFSFPSGGHWGGKDLFVEQICREGGLDSTLSLEFQCCDPLDGSVIILKGLGALHASVFCATINAAARRARNKAAAAAASSSSACACPHDRAASHAHATAQRAGQQVPLSSAPSSQASAAPALATTQLPSSASSLASSAPGHHVLTRSTSAPPCLWQQQGLPAPLPDDARACGGSGLPALVRSRTSQPAVGSTSTERACGAGGSSMPGGERGGACTGCRVLDVYNNYLRRVVVQQGEPTALAPNARPHRQQQQHHQHQQFRSDGSSNGGQSQEPATTHAHHHHYHCHSYSRSHSHSRHGHSRRQREYGEVVEEDWLVPARRHRDQDTEAHRMRLLESERAAASGSGGRALHSSTSLLAKCKQSLRRVLWSHSHYQAETPSWL